MSTEPEDDLKADWSPNELSVLRSADLDTPPHGAVDRTLAAIGVGAALGAGVGVGTASSLGSAAQASRMAHGSMWLKWASAALVGCGIAAAVFLHRHQEKNAPVVVATSAPPAVAATPSVEPSSAVAEAPNAAPAMPAQPAAAPAAALPPASVHADASSKPDAGKDDIAAEIRIIDSARDHLRHGDPQGSLAALAEYDKLVKHGGSMRAEATVVRIEAYQASGDSARASSLGQRFLAKNPDSPYADYVKRILAKAN